MPYTLKTQQIAVKDPDTGAYVGVDILAEQTTEGLLNEINVLSNNKKNEITQLGDGKKQAITDEATSQLSAITQLGDGKKQAITDEATSQLSAITQLGDGKKQAITDEATSQLSAITQLGDGKKQTITDEGSAQVQAINSKGQEVLASIPNDYTELTKTVKSLARGSFMYDTASGITASFEDGADGMPIRKLVAQIEPVQDLHGYANPWPAGGGKNLLPFGGLAELKAANTVGTWTGNSYKRNGITYELLTDNSGNVTGIKASGTASAGSSFAVRSANFTLLTGTYKFSGVSEARGGYDLNIRKQGSTTDIVQSGSEVTITLAEDTVFDSAYLWVNSGKTLTNAYIYPMIRLATETDATFAPYENLCPIGGWTGAKATRTGKNLCGSPLYTKKGYISSEGIEVYTVALKYTESYIPVKKNTIYSYNSNNRNRSYVGNVVGYNKAKEFIRRITEIPSNTSHTIFSTGDAEYIRISITADDTEIGLYEGNINTYEPYTGNQISVTFPETIYGGEDEVISGKLTDNMKSVKVSDLPVNAPFEVGTHACWKRFTLPATCKPVPYTQAHGSISSMGIEATNYYGTKHINEASAIDVDYAISPDGQLLAVYDSDLSLTDETFMAKYGDMQVVYPLAEPVEYTLTENEMTTLYGTNNIWADTGDVTVTAPKDTKLYIDGKLAEIQATILENIGG